MNACIILPESSIKQIDRNAKRIDRIETKNFL